MSKPDWDWYILSLCRGSDPDRAPRFFKTLDILGAQGSMCDLDDGPEQTPLKKGEIEEAILRSLPLHRYDLLITHSPAGEYTRHRRHEEVGEAVITLWHTQRLRADELWIFAYEDGNKEYRPQPIKAAHLFTKITEEIWKKKYDLITKIYGFPGNGFEAETTPRAEAFWRFSDPRDAQKWLVEKKFQNESSIVI